MMSLDTFQSHMGLRLPDFQMTAFGLIDSDRFPAAQSPARATNTLRWSINVEIDFLLSDDDRFQKEGGKSQPASQ